MTAPGTPITHAEDLSPGVPIRLGSYTVTAEEIIEFAGRWDPQRFHLDPDAAAETPFGGLIASGMHTIAIFQRLAAQGAYSHWKVIAGRTIREIQLPAPVRPGATVDGELTVQRVQHVRADRSMVTVQGLLLHDERVVLELCCDAYVGRRPGRHLS